MKIIDELFCNKLIDQAENSPRKRAHHNLHPQLDDPIQRLCVAACKGTYIRPHRHPEENKWEMFSILKGSGAILLFDDNGVVTERIDLSAGNGAYTVELPPGIWHTLIITSSQSVLIKTKPGPYTPLSENNFASWAPVEGDGSALKYEEALRTAKSGDIPHK